MPDRAPTTAPGEWRRDSSRSSEAGLSPTGSRTPGSVSTCAAHVSYQLSLARPVVLACDPSAEGVLAAVGVTYLAHALEGQVRLASIEGLQARIGEQVVRTPAGTDDDTAAFARRVITGFARSVTPGCKRRRKGVCPAGCEGSCVRRVALACASDRPDMPEVVHRYLRLGFSVGARVRTLITDQRVAELDGLARYVLNECEHTRQFVRFSHMADGSFSASFSPSANTIPLCASHFAARMRQDRFVLADPRHRIVAFHHEGARDCQIVRLDGPLMEALLASDDLADDERYVRAMWQRFYRGTSLPGRSRSERGYDLRTKWMPQRLWDGLLELEPPVPGNEGRAPARYAGGGQAAPYIQEAPRPFRDGAPANRAVSASR